MFTNNSLLCRFMIRRDRVRTLVWIASMMSLVLGFALIVPDMYGSDAERLVMAETLKSPAMVAMMGPVYDTGGFTVGALYTNFMLQWSVILMGIMNIFLVVRHTRQDEESGRIEVVRSLPVGRMSNLSAVLSFSLILNTVIALIAGFGLTALKLESMDLAGSMLFGAALGITGLCFAGATAIFCQLTENSQTAMSMSFAFTGVAFLLRAVGDMQSETLALISPLGLILRSEVYTSNKWWPFFVMLGESLVFSVLAVWLCGKRDMGAGLIPAKPGRRDAPKSLNSAGALAWRLLRMPFIVWMFVVYIIAAAYGSVMGDIESFVATNDIFKMIFPDGDPAYFVSFLMVIMAILGTIPILQFMLKARAQEKGGFAENILARSSSRYRQLAGYFITALAASAVMPVLIALGFYSGSVPVMDTPIPFDTYLKASLVYIPATWVMLGLSMLLIAYLPRLTAIVWAYLGYGFFILYMGSIMQLPEWMNQLSPYNYVPRVPAEDFSATPLIVMTLMTVVMAVVAFIGYSRRDMEFS